MSQKFSILIGIENIVLVMGIDGKITFSRQIIENTFEFMGKFCSSCEKVYLGSKLYTSFISSTFIIDWTDYILIIKWLKYVHKKGHICERA